MSESVLHSVIKEFGSSIGIGELAFDEEQRCNLMFDDVPVSIELSGNEDSLFVYSVLAPEPKDGVEELYAKLLKANYAFAQTNGSTVALDPMGGGIVLMREEPAEMLRLAQFEALLESFVNTAESFMESLSGDPPDEPEPNASKMEMPQSVAVNMRV